MTATAKCDRTGNVIPLENGFFAASRFTGEWEFVSVEAPEKQADYDIQVKDIIKSPESLVDWLAHLYEKTWFKPDLFFNFFTKFRKENGLYGKL